VTQGVIKFPSKFQFASKISLVQCVLVINSFLSPVEIPVGVVDRPSYGRTSLSEDLQPFFSAISGSQHLFLDSAG